MTELKMNSEHENNRKHTIYIVDNNKLKAGLLRKYLLNKFENKVNIYIYFSGRSCLRMMNGSVDLVIYDSQNKKGWNAKQGVDILKTIKERFPKTTVVMHTSNDDVTVAIEAMRLGATDYVVKNSWSLMRIVELVENTITQPIRKLVAEFGVPKFVLIFFATFVIMAGVVFWALNSHS